MSDTITCFPIAVFLIGDNNRDRLAESYHPCLHVGAIEERSTIASLWTRDLSRFHPIKEE